MKYPGDHGILILGSTSPRLHRFEFILTPTHGSGLNLVESFFGKIARALLRGIRVHSRDELKVRIQQVIDRINADPVVVRWTYKMDETSVV